MIFTLTPSARPEGYGEAIVSVARCKEWLRVDSDWEDELIAVLRDAAIDMVEQYSNLRLGPAIGEIATFSTFGERMRPGIGPAATMVVTAVDYIDAAGADVSIDVGSWRVDSAGGLVPPVGGWWPSGASQVKVTFDVGYPAGACPSALKQAALMFVAHLYANREAVVTGVVAGEVPLGFRSLCDRYRMPVL